MRFVKQRNTINTFLSKIVIPSHRKKQNPEKLSIFFIIITEKAIIVVKLGSIVVHI